MRILNCFKKEMNQTAYFYSHSKNLNQSTGYSQTQENYKGKVRGFLFIGSAADRLVSEKVRPNVDAILIIDPLHINFEISDSDRVVIESTIYNVVKPDNIGFQNDVTQILLKENN